MGSHPRKIGARGSAYALLTALALLCACARGGAMRPAAQHVVRPGDTLGSIAAGYGVSTERLARANRLRDADRIAPGQRVRIPDGARIVHRVRGGEALQQIGTLYRVRVSTIARLNRLGRSTRLEPGQRLILPREARLPAPTTARLHEPPPVAAAPPPVRLREPPPLLAAPPPAIDPNIQRARALVDRSVEDYRSARFERAVARANEADAMLAPGNDRDAQPLRARAVFVSASSLAALGETDRAQAEFARVHALDPQFEPPRGWLSPRLEKLYLAARNP